MLMWIEGWYYKTIKSSEAAGKSTVLALGIDLTKDKDEWDGRREDDEADRGEKQKLGW